jgi:hypothetical protein
LIALLYTAPLSAIHMTLVCVQYPDPSLGTMPDDLSNALIDQMGKTAFSAFFASLPSASVGWIAVQDWPTSSPTECVESVLLQRHMTLSLAVRVRAFGCWCLIEGIPQRFVWTSVQSQPDLVLFASDGLLELMVEQ